MREQKGKHTVHGPKRVCPDITALVPPILTRTEKKRTYINRDTRRYKNPWVPKKPLDSPPPSSVHPFPHCPFRVQNQGAKSPRRKRETHMQGHKPCVSASHSSTTHKHTHTSITA